MANLGELMSDMFRQFLILYKNENIAAVATAAVINKILAGQKLNEIECLADDPSCST